MISGGGFDSEFYDRCGRYRVEPVVDFLPVGSLTGFASPWAVSETGPVDLEAWAGDGVGAGEGFGSAANCRSRRLINSDSACFRSSRSRRMIRGGVDPYRCVHDVLQRGTSGLLGKLEKGGDIRIRLPAPHPWASSFVWFCHGLNLAGIGKGNWPFPSNPFRNSETVGKAFSAFGVLRKCKLVRRLRNTAILQFRVVERMKRSCPWNEVRWLTECGSLSSRQCRTVGPGDKAIERGPRFRLGRIGQSGHKGQVPMRGVHAQFAGDEVTRPKPQTVNAGHKVHGRRRKEHGRTWSRGVGGRCNPEPLAPASWSARVLSRFGTRHTFAVDRRQTHGRSTSTPPNLRWIP